MKVVTMQRVHKRKVQVFEQPGQAGLQPALGSSQRCKGLSFSVDNEKIPRDTAHPTQCSQHSLAISSSFITTINMIPLKYTYPDITTPLISTFTHPSAQLTLSHRYLKSISYFTCPKTKSWFSLIPQYQLSLPAVFHISINGCSSLLSLTQVEDSGVCCLTAHSTCQQILTTLPSSYFQNSTTSQHPCH